MLCFNKAIQVLKKLKLFDLLEKELKMIEDDFFIEDQESSTNIEFNVMSQLINDRSKNSANRQSQIINESIHQSQMQTSGSVMEQSSYQQQETQNENNNVDNNDSTLNATVHEEKKTSRKRKIDTSALLELHSQFQAEVSTTQVTSQSSKKYKTTQSNTASVVDNDVSVLSHMSRKFTSNFNDDDLDLDI